MGLYYIYVHITPDGKHYVGKTKKFPKYRWNNGDGYSTQPFYEAIQKYGWNNIEHAILEYDLTKEEAEKRESHYIKLWNSDNPDFRYNKTSGGTNCKYSKDSKTKMRISQKKRVKKYKQEKKNRVVGFY